MRVVVTEKPSVARDLARVLGASGRGDGYLEGDGLVITWCVGHLLQLAEPDHYNPAWKRWSFDALPMIPERFELEPRDTGQDQYKIVKKILKDRSVTEVVNACDAGREGELIFRWVYEHAGCTRPVQRLWVSSLTDDAIKDGWKKLRPASNYDALGDAARCRAEADWLVGLNSTRAMTIRGRQSGGEGVLSIGRVQTPTLAMIVRRDLEILAFVPETYFKIEGVFEADTPSTGPAKFTGTFFRPDLAREEEKQKADRDTRDDRDGESEAPKAERFADRAHAEQVAAAARGRVGRLEVADRKRIREKPPWLYDLTSLQRRANQRYGLSAQRTLEIAQDLYEKHKLITYPRTDARFLTTDQGPELPKILGGLRGLAVYAPHVDALLNHALRTDRIIDDAEVGDHHAIIPTGRRPEADRLNPDEKRVFDLVARRLLAAMSPDAEFDVTALVVAVPTDAPLPEDVTSPLRFRARGRVCVAEGWRAVDPPGANRQHELPNVQAGAEARTAEANVKEGQTRPPRPYDDASILLAMETAGRDLDDAALKRAMRHAGLGTPATRAAILQTILDRKYVERRGKELRATARGTALIQAIPIEEMKSAELTGRWEARLAHVAEGRETRAAFMSDVGEHLKGLIERIAKVETTGVLAQSTPQVEVGKCPKCGQPVRRRGAVYACDTGRSCEFVVFGTMAKREISERMVKELLKEGKTKAVKGFTSKAGKPFSAGLTVKEDGTCGMWFPEREEASPQAPGPGGRTGSPPQAPPARSRPQEAAEAPRRGRDPDAGTRGSARARDEAPKPRVTKPKVEAPKPSAHPDEAPRGPTRSSGAPRVGAPCPSCGQGTLIAGRVAIGCSRWREGCEFRAPLG